MILRARVSLSCLIVSDGRQSGKYGIVPKLNGT